MYACYAIPVYADAVCTSWVHTQLQCQLHHRCKGFQECQPQYGHTGRRQWCGCSCHNIRTGQWPSGVPILGLALLEPFAPVVQLALQLGMAHTASALAGMA